MAKKRLNRKVALIGSAVILLLIFAAIAVILQLNRDPEKFIKDGDTALAAKDYDAAIRNYNKARGFAKTDELRIDIFSKLIDIYIETNQWRNALGFWNAIVKIEPGNTKARFGKLEYIYTVADNGAARVWQDVAEQADEFLEIADDSILEANIKDLVTYGLKDTDSYRERYGKYENVDTKLGPYLYLLRGRAIYEITKIGAVTEQKDSITKAISDMERSVELAPYNVDAYWYLAQAIITKGKILASMGNPQEKQNAARQAGELLEKAVELLPENVKAHINRLSIQPAVKQMVGVEQIKQLEPEYLSLTEKFPTSPQAYAALCAFYRVMGYKSLDNAVIAIEKAIELDRENVAYVKVATNLIYQKFSIYRAQDDFDKAIGLAKNGLTLPGCQDIPGPFQSINRVNRISLNVFLAKCYLEQILDPALPMDDEQRQLWLKNAEIYVHEVEQILGSGENPVFVIWQGMLELAKGNKTLATKKLYAVYEQLKAAEAINKTTGSAQLCYTLAGIFKDTQELGAVREFLINALNANIAQAKPKVYLELAEVFLKLNDPTTALSIINIFEEKYDADKKSQSLRTKAYIVSRQFDQAQRQLDESSADDPNTIKMKLALTQAKMQQLQMTISQKQMQDSLATLARAKKADTQSDIIAAELQTHSDELVNLVEKLLVIEPNSVKGRDIAVLCENYLKNDRIEDAKNLTTKYLALYPDDTIAQLYLQILAEPDPAKVSLQRRSEIEEPNLLKIKDLPKRLFNLAMFYQRNKNNEKAVETLREILQIPDDDLRIPIKERQLSNEETFATELLFNIALGNIDWDMATMITEFATRENLDQ
ncbi:MAG: tetratricopeptide repeat protein, partial [Planctomycetota bacterium]